MPLLLATDHVAVWTYGVVHVSTSENDRAHRLVCIASTNLHVYFFPACHPLGIFSQRLLADAFKCSPAIADME